MNQICPNGFLWACFFAGICGIHVCWNLHSLRFCFEMLLNSLISEFSVSFMPEFLSENFMQSEFHKLHVLWPLESLSENLHVNLCISVYIFKAKMVMNILFDKSTGLTRWQSASLKLLVNQFCGGFTTKRGSDSVYLYLGPDYL